MYFTCFKLERSIGRGQESELSYLRVPSRWRFLSEALIFILNKKMTRKVSLAANLVEVVRSRTR
jgi:hypothetical protein